MPGLVPGTHVLAVKTWMAGTKPGHDEDAAWLFQDDFRTQPSNLNDTLSLAR